MEQRHRWESNRRGCLYSLPYTNHHLFVENILKNRWKNILNQGQRSMHGYINPSEISSLMFAKIYPIVLPILCARVRARARVCVCVCVCVCAVTSLILEIARFCRTEIIRASFHLSVSWNKLESPLLVLVLLVDWCPWHLGFFACLHSFLLIPTEGHACRESVMFL